MRWMLGAVAFVAISACALVTSLDDLGGSSDGASDVPLVLDAPPDGCAVGVSPQRVVLDLGETSKDITVTIARGANVTGAATVSINGLPPQISASSLTIGGTSGTFSVAVPASMTLQTVNATVVASIGSITCQSQWQLVIGSVLGAFTTSGTYAVPAGETSLMIDAWGAGGGSSHFFSFGAVYPGAAGGFVEATVGVTPSESLTVTIGRGGGIGEPFQDAGATGGGGGGYTGVARGSTLLVIAGAGGGAGESAPGGGGGTSGGDSSDAGGFGGTQSAGGKGFGNGNGGASLQGGDGRCRSPAVAISGAQNGGDSGGGNGVLCQGTIVNYPGGGGGAGFFGGAGGYFSGGGGGSGFAETGATDVTMLTASGTTPPNTTSIAYLADAGVGGTGDQQSNARPGSDGRVVFRLPKWNK